MEKPQSREEMNRIRFREMGQRIFDERIARMYLGLPTDTTWDELQFTIPEDVVADDSIENKRAWVDGQMYQTLTEAENSWTRTGDDSRWYEVLRGTKVWYEHCIKRLGLIAAADVEKFVHNWENPDGAERYEFRERFRQVLSELVGNDASRRYIPDDDQPPEFYQSPHP